MSQLPLCTLSIIIITMVLSSWQSHCENYLAHVMNAEKCQVADDFWIKLIGLNNKPN